MSYYNHDISNHEAHFDWYPSIQAHGVLLHAIFQDTIESRSFIVLANAIKKRCPNVYGDLPNHTN